MQVAPWCSPGRRTCLRSSTRPEAAHARRCEERAVAYRVVPDPRRRGLALGRARCQAFRRSRGSTDRQVPHRRLRRLHQLHRDAHRYAERILPRPNARQALAGGCHSRRANHGIRAADEPRFQAVRLESRCRRRPWRRLGRVVLRFLSFQVHPQRQQHRPVPRLPQVGERSPRGRGVHSHQ